jgi:hypothetical protein
VRVVWAVSVQAATYDNLSWVGGHGAAGMEGVLTVP